MKKILLGLCVILGLINMIGCSSDEKYPMPTSIDQNSLSAEAKAGAIKLKWTVPADSNYYYVKVTYTLPEDGKKCMRLASVNSDNIATLQSCRGSFAKLQYHGTGTSCSETDQD